MNCIGDLSFVANTIRVRVTIEPRCSFRLHCNHMQKYSWSFVPTLTKLPFSAGESILSDVRLVRDRCRLSTWLRLRSLPVHQRVTKNATSYAHCPNQAILAMSFVFRSSPISMSCLGIHTSRPDPSLFDLISTKSRRVYVDGESFRYQLLKCEVVPVARDIPMQKTEEEG